MIVREYLKRFDKYSNVTFIKVRARKDAHTPYYHAEYQTTSIQYIREWENSNIMDYYILNNKQHPIVWLSGANWEVQFNNGSLISLLVISKEDLELLYNTEQAANLIKYIDEKLS